MHVCPFCCLAWKRVQGKSVKVDKKRRRPVFTGRLNGFSDKAVPFQIIVFRLNLAEILGINDLRNEFVFARKGADAHNNGQASGGHLVQPMVG